MGLKGINSTVAVPRFEVARVPSPLPDCISMIVLDQKQVKKTTEVSVEGPFSAHDTLREGFKSVSHDLAPKHPLQNHLKNVN